MVTIDSCMVNQGIDMGASAHLRCITGSVTSGGAGVLAKDNQLYCTRKVVAAPNFAIVEKHIFTPDMAFALTWHSLL